MSVQIIITGDHATDTIAELQNLSTALNGPNPVRQETIVVHSTGKTGEKLVEEDNKAQVVEEIEDTPKKLSRTEQERAMNQMIEAGEKDDRFDLLSKGRQNQVEKSLEKANIEPEEVAQEDDIFSDEPEETPEEITPEMIRDMMAKKGMNANKEPIQENLLEIRKILTKFVPKGAEVKVGNIPSNKLVDVYESLQGLGN